MIVTYEVGDYVNIEDNTAAGIMAAEDVRLIAKVGAKKWKVEECDSGRIGTVSEHWFSPC